MKNQPGKNKPTPVELDICDAIVIHTMCWGGGGMV